MKNLHYLKKFAAIVVSAMMVLSTLALPTFAAGSPTVSGLESGVVATPYKIADVTTDGNIERINAVGKTVIADLEEPTSGEILNLAAKIKAGTSGLTAGTAVKPGSDGVATFTDLPNGIYIVTFSVDSTEGAATPEYIYNPVIISVGKEVKSLAIGDNTKYEWGDTAQVKKSKIPFDKVVDRDKNKNGEEGTNADNSKTNYDEKIIANDGNRGDTAGEGDTVYFRINTAVPAYADNYFTTDLTGKTSGAATNPKWQVWDKLSAGLTFNDDVKVFGVKSDGTVGELPAGDFTVTTTEAKNAEEENCTFVVKLTDAALYRNRGQDVEIRYSADINENAKTNFEADTNNAGCDYSREPGSDAKPGEERTTYHYTFTINGALDGNDADTWNNREILKVGVDEESGQIIFEETSTSGTTIKGWTALKGITFKLYKKSDVNNDGTVKSGAEVVRDGIESDKDGILRGMNRLDAGEYRLVEDQDQAQFKTGGDYAGKYNAKTTPIDITIEATLRDDGRLDSYEVKVNGTSVGSYKKDYDNNTYDSKGTIEPDQDGEAYEVDASGTKLVRHDVIINSVDSGYDDYGTAADILNSKIGTLPATGGMGTVLFTVGGIAIMALAIFLLFGGKKKQEQK